MVNLELSEQEIIRRSSLEELRKLGIEPYPAAEYVVTGYSDEIRENFVDLPKMLNDEGVEVPTPANADNSLWVMPNDFAIAPDLMLTVNKSCAVAAVLFER